MNVAGIIPRFLGVNVIGRLNALISSFFITYVLNRVVALFSQTFLIIYFLYLVDVGLLGILLAITAIFESLIDYPTAGLSKRIGHNWVHATAMLSFAVMFLLLTIAETPAMLVVIMIFRAVGKSQQSGVIQAYFDESYSLIGQQDYDRSIYNSVLSKTTLLMDLLGYLSALAGAYLAVVLPNGRITVFRYQAYGLIAMAILGVVLMKDYGKESIGYDLFVEKQKSPGKMTQLLRSPKVLVMTLGAISFFVVKEIWYGFIMWPVFYAYTGDDFVLAFMNMLIFLLSTIFLLLFLRNRGGNRGVKLLPAFTILQGLVGFLPVIYITNVYPLNDTFQLIPVIVLVGSGVFSLILSISIVGSVYRVLLDLIPSSNQSSYHSFLPSITLVLMAPLYYFSGLVIEAFGYATILIVLIFSLVGGAGMFWIAIHFLDVGALYSKEQPETELPYISASPLSSVSFALSKYASPVTMSDLAATVWIHLVGLAGKDEKITENEMRLLIKSMENINTYSELLKEVVADNILTEDERQKLIETKTELIVQLQRFARESDDLIDLEEKAILEYVEEIFSYIKY